MGHRFHSFVVFAEMRTGSNFLEANLNALDGVACVGEAFNPHFIGYPERDALLGVTLAMRDDDPAALLDKFREAPDLTGFRYFNDHDPRVLDRVLADTGCAKIVLKRDPVGAYVSWKIARATGQWKLTDVRKRRAAEVTFEPVEFDGFVQRQAEFRHAIMRQLQVSGQTAFHLDYEDLQSLDVMNGLAAFLGVEARLDALDHRLKVQNPEPLAQKVRNPAEMEAALAARAAVDPGLPPDFEPRRFAVVPSYILGAHTPLIYMPVKSGLDDSIRRWLAGLDAVAVEALQCDLTQRQLRQWKRANRGHRSFTVLRHPVLRAHHAFCAHILGTGPQTFKAIRRTLVNRFKLSIPLSGPDDSYDLVAHRAGFVGFLRFLARNLSGQTPVRVDASWCSQAQVLKGFCGFAPPDHVFREIDLPEALPELARRVGGTALAYAADRPRDQPFDVMDIYDPEIETLAAAAYQRDYMMFGFEPLA